MLDQPGKIVTAVASHPSGGGLEGTRLLAFEPVCHPVTIDQVCHS